MVAGKIEGEGKAFFDPVQSGPHSFIKARKNLKGGGDVAVLRQLSQLGRVGVLVRFEVAVQEEGMVVVQGFHIILNPILGALLSQGFSRKVVILQEFLDENRRGFRPGLGSWEISEDRVQSREEDSKGDQKSGNLQRTHKLNIAQIGRNALLLRK